MPRNPFAFLDEGSKDRTLLLLLLAIIRKEGGEIKLALTDLTDIEDGSSFHKYPDDTGTSLVLRFARRGAEAFFLPPSLESKPSQPTAQRRSTPFPEQEATPLPVPPSRRHAIHDDLDLALREDEMAQRAETAQRERLTRARAEAGAMPWRNQPPLTRQ